MKTLLTLIIFGLGIFFIQAQDWQTDWQTAKSLAQKENRPIILVFSGSDWCAPCIKLDKKIWQSEDFKAYAKDHYVMLKADFPRRKKNRLPEAQQAKNEKLAEIYNPNGNFPLVVVLNAKGKVLGTTGYKRRLTPNDYIKLLNSFL